MRIKDDDGSSLVGQRHDLERMLRNLLENAIRYSPAGEPFYRSASSRAAAPEGAGLGLAIAREIARAHCGEVRRSNTPRDRGTEFVVLLPVEEPTAGRRVAR